MKTVGSRAEVYHGVAKRTSGYKYKKDFFLDTDGRIKSIDASQAQVRRMEREGDKHLTKVFAPKDDGKFHRQPKKGTKRYEELIKKMKK